MTIHKHIIIYSYNGDSFQNICKLFDTDFFLEFWLKRSFKWLFERSALLKTVDVDVYNTCDFTNDSSKKIASDNSHIKSNSDKENSDKENSNKENSDKDNFSFETTIKKTSTKHKEFQRFDRFQLSKNSLYN